MLHFIVLLLAFVVPYTQQQQSSSIATCQQVANQTVFKQCVSSVLGVKGTMGSQIASDQVGACYTQLNNGTAYQRCLCAKTSAILGCYESWCPGDAGEVVQFNYQLIFCKAYHAGQVLTAMPTLTGIPLAPTAGAVDAPTNAPIVPKNIGGKKSDALGFSVWPTVLTYAMATLLGLIFLLL